MIPRNSKNFLVKNKSKYIHFLYNPSTKKFDLLYYYEYDSKFDDIPFYELSEPIANIIVEEFGLKYDVHIILDNHYVIATLPKVMIVSSDFGKLDYTKQNLIKLESL